MEPLRSNFKDCQTGYGHEVISAMVRSLPHFTLATFPQGKFYLNSLTNKEKFKNFPILSCRNLLVAIATMLDYLFSRKQHKLLFLHPINATDESDPI